MPTPRTTPYLWVTWLSGLLSGDKSCEWASWFKAHNTSSSYTKRPNNFDTAAWKINHAALLAPVRDEYRAEGYEVTVEDQNSFQLDGKAGTLAGKPDLVAIKGNAAIIVDTKTGQPRASDTAQVMVYMWAMRLARPTQFKGKTVDGLVVYRTGKSIILASEVNPDFIERLRGMIVRLCGKCPPVASPSAGECGFCDITSEDCSERYTGEGAESVETDQF